MQQVHRTALSSRTGSPAAALPSSLNSRVGFSGRGGLGRLPQLHQGGTKQAGRFHSRGFVSVVETDVPHAVRDTNATVDAILEKVKGSDGGMALSDAQKDAVDLLLDELDRAGKGARPNKDPLLFGNYVVAYTSTRRAPSERGQPSGGRFRGAIGRRLFQTTGLFQSVLQGDPAPVAVNKVAFKLFGLLPGYVGLRGVVEPTGDAEDTVNVHFEPPVLSLANSINLRIGPKSSVQLTTTYLDQKIRIGKGSRGSLFVFVRGGDADHAAMEVVGRQKTTVAGTAALCLFFASLVLGGVLLWASAHPVLRAGALLAWLLTAGMGAVLNKGGIIQDDRQRAEQARAGPADANKPTPA